MPDDHSEVVPLLPIPNRTVKRLCADDSADSRVKVGHRQAIQPKTPRHLTRRFFRDDIGDVNLVSKKRKKIDCMEKPMLEYKASLITAKQIEKQD